MKITIIVSLSLLALIHSPLCEAHPRLFSNTDGKTIRAELANADDTNAWLRLDSGRTSKVSLAKLSEADRDFVAAWRADQVPDLEIRPNFKRSTKSDPWGRHQILEFQIEIENRDPAKALEECEAVYFLIGRSVQDKTVYKILSRQTQPVSIPAQEKQQLFFKKIKQDFSRNSIVQQNGFAGNFKALGYVLQLTRKRDGRTVYLQSPTSALENAKYIISSLKSGDVTDNYFTKLEDKNEQKDGVTRNVVRVRSR